MRPAKEIGLQTVQGLHMGVFEVGLEQRVQAASFSEALIKIMFEGISGQGKASWSRDSLSCWIDLANAIFNLRSTWLPLFILSSTGLDMPLMALLCHKSANDVIKTPTSDKLYFLSLSASSSRMNHAASPGTAPKL